jgi:hypothetical protein
MNTKLISAVLIVCLTLTVAAGAAVGQSNSTTTGTATDPSNETTTVQTTIQLSPTTEIVRWTYAENGTFAVTIKSATPTRISVIDAGSLVAQLSEADGATSATATSRSFNLGTGTRTVTFDATKVDGEAAVSLSATGGRGIAILTSGAISAGRPPVAYGTAQAAAGMAAVSAAGGAYLFVRRRRQEQQKDAERVL